MFRPLASFSVRGRFIPSTSRLLSTAFSPEDIEAEEKRFREVFEGNRKWVQTVNNESPGLFEELAKEQKPRYLTTITITTITITITNQYIDDSLNTSIDIYTLDARIQECQVGALTNARRVRPLNDY